MNCLAHCWYKLPLLLLASVSGCAIGDSAPAQEKASPKLAIEREIILRGAESQLLAWSPNGQFVASAGPNGDVLIVDVAKACIVHDLLVSDYAATALLFSPDSLELVIAGQDVSHWSPVTGVCASRHEGVAPIAFSDDGKWLAAAETRFSIGIWSAADGQKLHTVRTSIDAIVHRLEFPSSGAQVILHRQGDLQQTVSLLTGSVVASKRALPKATPEAVRALKLRMKHKAPFAQSTDGESWVVATGGELTFHGQAAHRGRIALQHRLSPTGAEFTGDGKFLVVDCDGELTVLRASDGSVVSIAGSLPKGELLRYAGGSELVVWQQPHWSEPDPQIGRITFWSIDALCEGKELPVRTLEVETLRSSGTPIFSSNARFLGVGCSVRDVANLARSLGRVPEGNGTQVEPGAAGKMYLCSEPHQGCSGESGLMLSMHDRQGAKHGDRMFLGLWFSPCPRARRSPTGRHVAVIDSEGLHLLATPALEDVWPRPIDAEACAWWDANRLLVLGSDGMLDLLSIESQRTVTLEIPRAPALPELGFSLGRLPPSIVVDPRGRRAAIVERDRITMVQVSN